MKPLKYFDIILGLFVAVLLISNYIFKVGFEVIFTPVTYRIVHFLKKKEEVDIYDYGTNFNPFTLKV